jgi:hypothetical protein
MSQRVNFSQNFVSFLNSIYWLLADLSRLIATVARFELEH